MTDELDLRMIGNEFIALNENRKRVFGFLKISYHLEKSVNRPYRLFTFTQWPRLRAKHLFRFPAQYN